MGYGALLRQKMNSLRRARKATICTVWHARVVCAGHAKLGIRQCRQKVRPLHGAAPFGNSRWFSPAAFQTPAIGTPGDHRRPVGTETENAAVTRQYVQCCIHVDVFRGASACVLYCGQGRCRRDISAMPGFLTQMISSEVPVTGTGWHVRYRNTKLVLCICLLDALVAAQESWLDRNRRFPKRSRVRSARRGRCSTSVTK